MVIDDVHYIVTLDDILEALAAAQQFIPRTAGRLARVSFYLAFLACRSNRNADTFGVR